MSGNIQTGDGRPQTGRPYLTAEQMVIIRDLREQGIDPDDITFLDNGEPWLASKVRLSIARESGEFSSLEEKFDQYIGSLGQVVHICTVERDGRLYSRSGIADVGEQLANGEVADAHELAASRAIGAALDAAGFNPLRRRATADRRRIEFAPQDPAETRLSQLKAIHALARDASLIVRDNGAEDLSKYREFLAEHYGVTTCAGMSETERASVIAALRIRVRG